MTIRSFVKSTVAAAPLSIALGVAAHAGGFIAPVVEPAVSPIVETAPVGNWAGAYAGATLGYAFGGEDRIGLAQGEGAVTNYDKLDLSGVNGGLRIGYRWQKDNWVFGPELGYEAGNIEDSFSNDGGVSAKSKIKNIVGLRFKTGYAVTPDTLVYGIIGAARAKVDYEVTGASVPGTAAINDSISRSGYIVGLGAEKQLTERVSITGEYEYANFGKETVSDAGGIQTEATAKYNNVKLGVNFRF
ncbi:outer membrane beta-barrel protein [Paracoccus sp. DMF-8]|uniref:outer membrane protein n=1 Tax=Paracoccus sp. DMF-8 TaxID=3019445 RepID=UPI0023E829D9|nr:outer membrane beta-barrel protein [Paracoccus sp. DMF-8]MDF3607004.1 outer membrane beta-barrel protein [Paracoccus sp. DMF-8]